MQPIGCIGLPMIKKEFTFLDLDKLNVYRDQNKNFRTKKCDIMQKLFERNTRCDSCQQCVDTKRVSRYFSIKKTKKIRSSEDVVVSSEPFLYNRFTKEVSMTREQLCNKLQFEKKKKKKFDET